MGHNVKYYGKLTAKNHLNKQEIELFKSLRKDDEYRTLYALEYKEGHFIVKDCEKIYPEPFYNAIEKYVKILKEGGNDLVDGSHLVSSSEYGIDEEAIVLVYRDGSFTQKKITDLVENYIYLVENYISNKDILFTALKKSELRIKNIETGLAKYFVLIYNDSFEELEIDKQVEILVEYEYVLDNYYLEIANACKLTIKLNIKKPSIFLNNLVKTLLDKRNTTLYDRLNKRRDDLDFEELDCYTIKDCETVMQKFIAMFPVDYTN